MSKEFIIYTDESDSKGAWFSRFYGGVLVRSDDIDHVRAELKKAKEDVGITSELKWTKVSWDNKDRMKDLMSIFFDLIGDDKIKCRIMFTQNTVIPVGLTKEQKQNEYLLLYYQFLKHAFGLMYAPTPPNGTRVRIYPDQIPDTQEKIEAFRSYLAALSKNKKFQQNQIIINKEDVTDVDSKEHILLQFLDIVLGSMCFRLNDKHKEKPAGKRVRAKKTRAKEDVYKSINKEIQKI